MSIQNALGVANRTAYTRLFLLFFLGTMGFTAHGQITWDGGASTPNWSDADNWSGNALPTASDEVFIGNGYAVTIPNGTAATALSLTVSGAATTLTIATTASLTLTGGSAYSFYIEDAGVSNSGFISINNGVTGIGLAGNFSYLDNGSSGTVSIDAYSGHGVQMLSAGSDCGLVNSGIFSIDNGSNSNAAAISMEGTSAYLIAFGGLLDIGTNSNAGIGIDMGAGGYILNAAVINIWNTGTGKPGILAGTGSPGTLSITSAGAMTFDAGIGGVWAGGTDLAVENNGAIDLYKAGAVDIVLKGTGLFSGTAQFSNTNSVDAAGLFDSGCILFNSGYANTGETNLNIGGTNQCGDFDVIFCSTTADISGTLNVSLINGFTPTAGQSFTIVNAASRTGNFSTVNYPSTPGISWSISYTSNSVIVTANLALPVELVEFTATPLDERNVLLAWQTAYEADHAGFQVERSQDGIAWENIGFVPGQGNSTKPKYYQFTDRPLANGQLYYRLRQLATNGNSELSKIATLRFASLEINSSLPISPNPTTGAFTINGDYPTDALCLVYDGSGRIVLNGNLSDRLAYNASTLPDGIYTVAIFKDKILATSRLMKRS